MIYVVSDKKNNIETGGKHILKPKFTPRFVYNKD